MKIYFDGTSWTWGAELDNPQEERFSKLICDKLGAEECNFSKRGGSNDRIVRNILVENDIKEYDLAIIEMTFPARTEYYNGETWMKVNPGRTYQESLHTIKDYDYKNLDQKRSSLPNNFWKEYYKVVGNELFFDTKEEIHFKTIRNHFKLNGVPLIFCTTNHWTKLKFDCLLSTKDIPRAPKKHPNKEGHRQIADKIIGMLTS